MTTEIYTSDSRGTADHGWLKSRHTFSFGSYHDTARMGFGLLRVINDDIVEPAMGFGTHPHENMEIISIPLTGSLRHEDSMGNQHVIRAGEVQIMSAGTGITHSEYNHSDSEAVNFLQIWVLPKKINITPRYDQKLFEKEARHNQFQLLVSPTGSDASVAINQDAWFSLTDLDEGKSLTYAQNKTGSGIYLFILKGKTQIDSHTLNPRDAIAVTEMPSIKIDALEPSQILCMEVPMS